MASETGNAEGKKENRGSDSPNLELQKRESRDPNKSNARDRTGRKGGDNAKEL
jgi:hypothetical protein